MANAEMGVVLTTGTGVEVTVAGALGLLSDTGRSQKTSNDKFTVQ